MHRPTCAFARAGKPKIPAAPSSASRLAMGFLSAKAAGLGTLACIRTGHWNASHCDAISTASATARLILCGTSIPLNTSSTCEQTMPPTLVKPRAIDFFLFPQGSSLEARGEGASRRMPPNGSLPQDAPPVPEEADKMDDDIKCTVCKDPGRADMMLLCDLCDGGWHR